VIRLERVDKLYRTHRGDPVLQAGLVGELAQQPERLVGRAVLGVIEEQPRPLDRKSVV